MIEYISEAENPCVIAFLSPNSVGAENTAKMAKSRGIPVIETRYAAAKDA